MWHWLEYSGACAGWLFQSSVTFKIFPTSLKIQNHRTDLFFRSSKAILLNLKQFWKLSFHLKRFQTKLHLILSAAQTIWFHDNRIPLKFAQYGFPQKPLLHLHFIWDNHIKRLCSQNALCLLLIDTGCSCLYSNQHTSQLKPSQNWNQNTKAIRQGVKSVTLRKKSLSLTRVDIIMEMQNSVHNILCVYTMF